MTRALLTTGQNRTIAVTLAQKDDARAAGELGRLVFDATSALAMERAIAEFGGPRDHGILLDPLSASVTSTFLVARPPDADSGSLLGVIGVYRLRWIGAHVAYVGWFAVTPDEQRSGIGSALLSLLEDLVSSIGVRYLFVETSPEGEGAIAFYQKRGFTLVGQIDDYWPNGSALSLYRKILHI